MSQQVLEGTWEEIMQHAEELSGKHVRLTIVDEFSRQPGDGLPIEERPLSELLEGLIGVIDSREPSPPFPVNRARLAKRSSKNSESRVEATVTLFDAGPLVALIDKAHLQ
jgi:hypothetical protein